VLDKEGYTVLKKDEENEYSIKELEINGQRLIVSYNRNNAKKDAYDRQQSIERLLAKIKKTNTNPTSLIGNFGYKKFIKVNGEATIEIDEEKIEKEKRCDGLHGIITNHTELKPEEVIHQYHGLWQVEENFRISKHDLKVRPVFHWTPKRIEAHIAICFMALTCARYLNYRIRTQQQSLSIEKIRQILTSIQISILKDIRTSKFYGVPSSIRQEAKKIYQTMGLKLSDVPFEIV